jgi:hypothetical protein
VLGVALLAALVAQNDPAAVLASIVDLSWRLAVIVCFPAALVAYFDTLGWRYAFLREVAPFRALAAARLAGEAFNMTTPTAAVGGEAVKAWLLRGYAPLDATLASVIVAKTTITLGQGLYFLLGVVVAWEIGLAGSPLLYGMIWFLAIEAIALALFVLVQMRGMLGWTGRVLERFGLRPASLQAMLGSVDQSLGQARSLDLVPLHRLAPRLGRDVAAPEVPREQRVAGHRDGDRGVQYRRQGRDIPGAGEPGGAGGRLRGDVRDARALADHGDFLQPSEAPARGRLGRDRPYRVRRNAPPRDPGARSPTIIKASLTCSVVRIGSR